MELSWSGLNCFGQQLFSELTFSQLSDKDHELCCNQLAASKLDSKCSLISFIWFINNRNPSVTKGFKIWLFDFHVIILSFLPDAVHQQYT